MSVDPSLRTLGLNKSLLPTYVVLRNFTFLGSRMVSQVIIIKIFFLFTQNVVTINLRLKAFLRDIKKMLLIKVTFQQSNLINNGASD